jgi:transposase IS66 family protein
MGCNSTVHDWITSCDEDVAISPPPADSEEVDLAERHEVGCWSHLRRKFWEAAITKDPVAREGLARISRIFELDRSWKKKSAAGTKSLRDVHLRPHTDAFFAWVDVEYERVRDQRGFLRTALGYAHRQRGPLTRSTMADSNSTTTPPSVSCGVSPSAGRAGCSSAATTTRKRPALCSR